MFIVKGLYSLKHNLGTHHQVNFCQEGDKKKKKRKKEKEKKERKEKKGPKGCGCSSVMLSKSKLWVQPSAFKTNKQTKP